MTFRAQLSLALVITALPTALYAAAPTPHLIEEESLLLPDGSTGRHEVRPTGFVPLAATGAWTRFTSAHGDRWRVWFDADTNVVGQVWGPGIDVPDATASPAAAERAARALLEDHIDLLAPGVSPSSFALVTNVVESNLRIIGFMQRHQGLDVLGGQISMHIKNDRIILIGSQALPHVALERATSKAPLSALQDKAMAWIVKAQGSKVSLRETKGPVVLPIIKRNAVTFHEVIEVVVDAVEPVGRWSVYLDVASGEPVARLQTLMFQQQTSTARFNIEAPERYPGRGRIEWPARRASIVVDGNTAQTDGDGNITWSGTSTVNVRGTANGALVQLSDESGALLTTDFRVGPGGSHTWTQRDSERGEAQLTAFVATERARDKAKRLLPTLRWLDQRFPVRVNLTDGNCNAFSDGRSTNFYVSSRRCENTARLPDVVYHEYGHAFHANAIIRGVGRFDRGLSEGIADVLSALITGDPGMGRGFFRNNNALRHLDESDRERKWPEDVGESHQTGMIYGQAFWDMRKALIASLGEQQGAEHTERLYMASVRQAASIPGVFAILLAEDDDDGDLSNGTPNYCEIQAAFELHGIGGETTQQTGIGKPAVSDLQVSLPVQTSVNCPGSGVKSAELKWQLRRDISINGVVPMTLGSNGYDGTLPTQPSGEVMQYQMIITMDDNETITFPANPSDPWYEQYFGEVVELYCTDFETDPINNDGWVHVLVSGSQREGADDWQWGSPNATQGSGDPGSAFSGTRVIGNDLGGGNYNGTYQPNKGNRMTAPSVNTEGYETIRLQYRRWLNVENGFFDQATISANGTELWSNKDNGERSQVHHADKEWRFHDVDLTSAVVDNKVLVAFDLKSDGGLNLGGWTIDDVCIVGIPAAPICGDGKVDAGEECDDGNQVDDDECTNACTLKPEAICGDGVLNDGEECDPGIDATTCDKDCTIIKVMTPTEPGTPSLGGDGGLQTAKPSSCGCETTERSKTEDFTGLLAMALLLMLRRRARSAR